MGGRRRTSAASGRGRPGGVVVLIAACFGISTIAALYRLNSLGLTARYEVLKQEVGEGLPNGIWERLAPAPIEDVLAALDPASLPRLSPVLAGSALATVADGAASVADAAGASRFDFPSKGVATRTLPRILSCVTSRRSTC